MTGIIGAGFRANFYGVMGTYGCIGSILDGATAGAAAGSPTVRLYGSRVFPVGIPEPDNTPVSGDDSPMVQFQFASEELPSGVIEVSARDLTFEALVQGTKVREVGSLDLGVLGPSATAQPDICFVLNRVAKSWDDTSKGTKKWEIILVHKCNVSVQNLNVEQRTFTPYQYYVTTSKSDIYAFGASYTELLDGVTQALMAVVASDNPMHLHSFKGDNSRTAFTLAYTAANVTDIVVTVNGVLQTYTTHYTVSGKTLTFVSAPAQDAVIDIFYPFPESELN